MVLQVVGPRKKFRGRVSPRWFPAPALELFRGTDIERGLTRNNKIKAFEKYCSCLFGTRAPGNIVAVYSVLAPLSESIDSYFYPEKKMSLPIFTSQNREARVYY
jgi:hypothetical protein